MTDEQTREAILIALDGFEAVIISLRKNLGAKQPVGQTALPQPKTGNLPWEDTSGEHGAFQICHQQKEPSKYLDVYVSLFNIVKVEINAGKRGKFITPYWYWIMQDGITLGRKVPARGGEK